MFKSSCYCDVTWGHPVYLDILKQKSTRNWQLFKQKLRNVHTLNYKKSNGSKMQNQRSPRVINW